MIIDPIINAYNQNTSSMGEGGGERVQPVCVHLSFRDSFEMFLSPINIGLRQSV